MFNVESEAELDAIARVAAAVGKVAPIALAGQPRRRPQDPPLHLDRQEGVEVRHGHRPLAPPGRAVVAIPSVSMIGMHMHIGSQITTAEPYAGAVAKGVELIGQLRKMGHPIAWYNMGGGYGIDYKGHEAKPIAEFARVIVPAMKATGCRLAMEPGRVIAGNAGILVSRVLYTKQSGEKRFLIQDAAMNDLIRPALYESFHRIWPVASPPACPPRPTTTRPRSRGPSPGTWSARSARAATSWPRTAPCPRSTRGDLLAVFSAGAYGMVMASNYNTRPRAAEILVDGGDAPGWSAAARPTRTCVAPGTDRDLSRAHVGSDCSTDPTSSSRETQPRRTRSHAYALSSLEPIAWRVPRCRGLRSGRWPRSGARPRPCRPRRPAREIFAKPPTTPMELWDAADYLIRTGQAEQAVPYLNKFLKSKPDDATLLQIRDRYGAGSILRLEDDPATRPFAEPLIEQAGRGRRGGTRPGPSGSTGSSTR